MKHMPNVEGSESKNKMDELNKKLKEMEDELDVLSKELKEKEDELGKMQSHTNTLDFQGQGKQCYVTRSSKQAEKSMLLVMLIEFCSVHCLHCYDYLSD
jgi:L-lysine 2,3-aminomutase